MIIKDHKPEVGIFEIVDNVFLKDSEDYQLYSEVGEFFDGTVPHLHTTDIKTLVNQSSYISDKTKQLFKDNPNAYLNYPRGRVDFNTKTRKFHIMGAYKFLSNFANVERVAREFHLPPLASGNLVLEADDTHYDY